MEENVQARDPETGAYPPPPKPKAQTYHAPVNVTTSWDDPIWDQGEGPDGGDD